MILDIKKKEKRIQLLGGLLGICVVVVGLFGAVFGFKVPPAAPVSLPEPLPEQIR